MKTTEHSKTIKNMIALITKTGDDILGWFGAGKIFVSKQRKDTEQTATLSSHIKLKKDPTTLYNHEVIIRDAILSATQLTIPGPLNNRSK